MVRRSTADRKKFYLTSLEDQRHILRAALEGMGKGDLRQALTVAICVRLLVHESGRSIPLLKKLKSEYLTLKIRELPTPPPESYSPFAPVVTIMRLPFGVSVSSSEPRIFINPNPDMSNYTCCGLGEWWTKLVLKVPGCTPLSRRDVVLGVADKEGAHADDEMTDNYRRVLESKPLKFTDGETELDPVNVTRFTVGAAGIEVLDMLDRTFPTPVPLLRSPV